MSTDERVLDIYQNISEWLTTVVSELLITKMAASMPHPSTHLFDPLECTIVPFQIQN